jgi:carboxymethylenebutenolidase
MLLLPRIKEFKSGVPFYGFPYSTGYANNTTPSSHISELTQPMLIIHGTRDRASNITDIYRYAGELDAADKYFEMKVYQGEGHGFMITNGSLSTSFAAQNAFREMTDFFDRTIR